MTSFESLSRLGPYGFSVEPQMRRYYITDRRAIGGLLPLLDVVRKQMHRGIDYIQIREKDLEARELFEFTLAVLEARNEDRHKSTTTKILINSRADIALAAGADGVHLPALAPHETLPNLLVARSCHTLQEVQEADAHLITFGPVFDTPHKGKARGLDLLGAACRLGKLVFALGGVTGANAGDCIAAGAQGIAGIRLFQQLEI